MLIPTVVTIATTPGRPRPLVRSPLGARHLAVAMSDAQGGRPDPNFSPLNIIILALIFGVAAIATDMYQPAFPSIRETFDTDPGHVQFSLSLFLYGNAIGHLFFGPLSDRYGRKPILLGGLSAYVIATVGCALAPSINEFLSFRTLQGAAAASGPVLVRALVNDRLARDHAARMLALLTGIMALLAMLTPVVGGWLVQHYSWRWIFFVIGAVAIIMLTLTAVLTRETLPAERRLSALGAAELITGYLEIARNVSFWAYVTPPALMFSAVFAYVGVNSFLIIDTLGISAQMQGVYFSCAASAYVAGSFASNRLVYHFGVERAIACGLILGVISASLATLASLVLPVSLPLILAPALATFFATALLAPIALSAAVSLFPLRGGSASAVAGFTQLTCAAVSTALGAWLVDDTAGPLHVFTLAVSLAAAGAWFAGRSLRDRSR